MAEAGWPRHALRVGLVEWRRSVRATRTDSGKLVVYGLAALFGLLLVGGGVLAILFVLEDAAGLRVGGVVRGNLALFWLFAAFIVAQRAVSLHGRVDAEPLVLTTVSARTVAVGLVVAETLRALSAVVVPVIVLTGAFVYTTGAVAAAVTVPFGVVCFVASAVAAGVAVGQFVALLVARVPFVARHRTGLGGGTVVAFFAAYAAFQYGGLGLPVGVGTLGALPPGWVADLFVLGSPVSGSLTRAAAVAVGGPVAVAGCAAVTVRVATVYWYTDPVDPTDEGGGDGDAAGATSGVEEGATRAVDERSPLAAAIAPLSVPAVGSRATRRVTELVLLRTRRNPARLSFLLAPLAVVGSMLVSLAGAGAGGVGLGLVPVGLALALSWLAGAAFALNPLGDEAPVLPATLLSTVGGRRFVRGCCLPGALVGVPLTVLATALATVVAGYAPVDAAGVVALALLLSVAALGLAPGVGTRFPRFDAVSAGRASAVVPPALSAVAVYSLAVGLPGVVAAVSLLAPGVARALAAALLAWLPSLALSALAGQGLPTAGLAAAAAGFAAPIRGVPLGTVRAVGYVLPLALVALAGYRGYRNAVRRFDDYRLN